MSVFPAYNVPLRRGTFLDLFSGGSFTRSSTATRMTGAATIVNASANERRIENRGDGLGDMLLMEPSRTNTTRQSQPTAGWGASAATLNVSAVDGPLGAGTAATVAFTANPLARATVASTSTPTDNQNILLSVWARADSGTGSFRFVLRQKDGSTNVFSSDFALTETWTRYDAVLNAGAGANVTNVGVANGSDGVARTIRFTAFQSENGHAWPSSYIVVPSTATITRSADSLSYAAGQYPASFLTSGFRLTVVPDLSSADFLALTGTLVVAGFNSVNNDFRLQVASGTVRARMLEAGVTRVQTSVGITFSRGQPITFTVRPGTGELSVSGASVGDGSYTGTAFSYPSGTMFVGVSPAGGSNFPGRLARYIEAL